MVTVLTQFIQGPLWLKHCITTMHQKHHTFIVDTLELFQRRNIFRLSSYQSMNLVSWQWGHIDRSISWTTHIWTCYGCQPNSYLVNQILRLSLSSIATEASYEIYFHLQLSSSYPSKALFLLIHTLVCIFILNVTSSSPFKVSF